jgi:hypothetical protein
VEIEGAGLLEAGDALYLTAAYVRPVATVATGGEARIRDRLRTWRFYVGVSGCRGPLCGYGRGRPSYGHENGHADAGVRAHDYG